MIPALEIQGISKSYAQKASPAVRDASLLLQKGQVLGLLGESGCGKTTLLRIIAGFEIPESGRVKIDGKTVVSEKAIVPPGERNIGMIFQDFALFPHLNVRDNILFGVKSKNRTERLQISEEMLALTNLSGLEHRKPGELSGGQQQRLALARCMATHPSLLLLDEPFSNLDVTLRQQVREQVSHLLKATETAAVLVTHDIHDAVSLCDEIAVMKDGEIIQKGDFTQIYNHPVNEYTARLSGEIIDLTDILNHKRPNEFSAEERLFIRPEKIKLRGTKPQLNARVIERRFAGNSFSYVLGSENIEIVLTTIDQMEPDTELNLFFNDDDLLRFDIKK